MDYPKDAAIGDDTGTETKEVDRSYLEVLADVPGVVAGIPSALYKAATGEGAEVEFPDLPEATEIEDIGFFESIAPNLKIMAARDDTGKAEIIRNSFKGDPRLGGVFSDKFNNPIVVWNDQPYYINKPGFSGQDIGTFIGEIAKYSPATEMASEAGENFLAPETASSKMRGRGFAETSQDIGTAASIGVAADVVVPGVLKPAGRIIRRGAQAAGETAESIFPRYTTAIRQVTPAARAVPQKSKYPLTAGQREAQPPVGLGDKVTPQLQAEDMLRHSPSTQQQAASIQRGFDEAVAAEIRADAQALKVEMGSDNPAIRQSEDSIGAGAERIQEIGSGRAAALKADAAAAYKAVEDAPIQPIFSPKGMEQTVRDAINAGSLTPREMAKMPDLRDELDYLKRLGKLASNPKFKGQPLTIIHGYQKTLNRVFRNADPESSEKRALGKIKNVIDKAVFDGIEQGFITGDQAILDQLKSATGLYRQYIGLVGKGSARDSQERATNTILEKITNPNYTPVQVAAAMLGHAKFNPNQSMGLVIDKLKAALPENESEEIMSLIKDGVLEKAFSGKGTSGVTRTNIVNNFQDVFVKQKAIIEKLFSPEEISKIRDFRDNVLPTMWAEIKLNPAGTGYLILAARARNQLLNYINMVPMVGKEFVESYETMKAIAPALEAVRQYKSRTSMPLYFDNITPGGLVSAAARPPAISDDADASVVLPLANTMSEAVKKRIIEAAQQ